MWDVRPGAALAAAAATALLVRKLVRPGESPGPVLSLSWRVDLSLRKRIVVVTKLPVETHHDG